MPHIHDKIDFTVEVFLVYKNTVLLRKHDKYDIWLSVGGHIEHDEDPNEAALREVKEEVGLEVKLDDSLKTFNPKNHDFQELIPPYFINRHKISETHEHVTFVYFAKANTNEIIQPENEKSDELKWFTKQDLESNPEIRENIKFYALKALETLSSNY